MYLALFMTYLKLNYMAPSWSQNGSFRRHFIHISLYSRRWSCFGSISFPKWYSLESQNGTNWSERVSNVQMALVAPQKVPSVLSVWYGIKKCWLWPLHIVKFKRPYFCQCTQLTCQMTSMYYMLWVLFIMFWFQTEMSTCWLAGHREVMIM